MPDAYETIRQAIQKKQHVLAVYDGHYREMCPHVLGRKNGRIQGLFYQFAGTSRSGLAPDGSASNWRCIPIDKLSDVQLRDGAWHTAANHSRAQTCVDQIDVEVEF